MVRAKLFVRSTKVPLVRYEMPNRDHYCSAAYRIQSVMVSFSESDRRAKELLSASGIDFELVDLSEKVTSGVFARLRGVKNTPTVLVDGHPRKKYEGLQNIARHIQEMRGLKASAN